MLSSGQRDETTVDLGEFCFVIKDAHKTMSADVQKVITEVSYIALCDILLKCLPLRCIVIICNNHYEAIARRKLHFFQNCESKVEDDDPMIWNSGSPGSKG